MYWTTLGKLQVVPRTQPTMRVHAVCAGIVLMLAMALSVGAASVLAHGGAASVPAAEGPLSGYVAAHKDTQHPRQLLGGPVHVKVSQRVGGVHVALPVERRLDADVFGTPEQPRRVRGQPMIDGVPLKVRNADNGEFTITKVMTPTGDTKSIVRPNGRMTLEAWDRTATDAAVTEDEVRFQGGIAEMRDPRAREATLDYNFEDEQGNTYGARCCTEMMPHGIAMPTFGGVVTNHMLHGSTGIWTSLMPTFFSPVTFWGYGDILKNGEVVDSNRLIHGMVTEYVRTEGYKMAFDRDGVPRPLELRAGPH